MNPPSEEMATSGMLAVPEAKAAAVVTADKAISNRRTVGPLMSATIE
jgi:hypothetical protein